jgi:CRP-like cAMP-binding protein
MERIYDKKKIASCIKKSNYHAVLDSLDIDFYLIKYKKGEFVSSPFQNESLFQIVEEGSINIYFIRDDGTRYSLSNGTTDYFLGDMDIFYPKNNNIYAEAAENLTCISFPIEKYRDLLLSNHNFLELICYSLSAKIGTMTTIDAAPSSLTERVLSYMKYKCKDKTLKGIEKAAFHLHCSARQLQRILNQSESAGLVKKLGKGTYKLM